MTYADRFQIVSSRTLRTLPINILMRKNKTGQYNVFLYNKVWRGTVRTVRIFPSVSIRGHSPILAFPALFRGHSFPTLGTFFVWFVYFVVCLFLLAFPALFATPCGR